MKFVFDGLVEYDGHDFGDGLMIGGKDVIAEIEFGPGKKVICGVLDERWDGELSIESGYGYSEYTVMAWDTLKVGNHDMLDILSRYEGKSIKFVISDEPIDLGDL